MSETSFILTLTSDPLPGIIAAVSTAVADLGGNITETNQHWDRPTNRFFLRVAFVGPEGLTVPAVEQALAPTVEKLGLDLKVTDAARPPKIIAMVSKFDHALLHLLYQIRVGWLRAEVAAIVSNHEDARRIADHEGIRFVHLPVTPETKPRAGGRAPRPRRGDRRRDSSSSPATCRSSPTTSPASSRAGRSTSTTRSCRPSRAPTPTSRPTSAA